MWRISTNHDRHPSRQCGNAPALGDDAESALLEPVVDKHRNHLARMVVVVVGSSRPLNARDVIHTSSIPTDALHLTGESKNTDFR